MEKKGPKKKKWKREKDYNFRKLQRNAIEKHDYIWKPPNDDNYADLQTGSWFNMEYRISDNIEHVKIDLASGSKPPKELRKAMKITMDLTQDQQVIMQKWFRSYVKMYNEALYFIRQKYQETKKPCIDWEKVRDCILEEKEIIQKSSAPNGWERMLVTKPKKLAQKIILSKDPISFIDLMNEYNELKSSEIKERLIQIQHSKIQTKPYMIEKMIILTLNEKYQPKKHSSLKDQYNKLTVPEIRIILKEIKIVGSKALLLIKLIILDLMEKFNVLKHSQVKEELEAYGLIKTGSKDVCIQRLVDFINCPDNKRPKRKIKPIKAPKEIKEPEPEPISSDAILIRSHMLDGAIKLACSNYKSAETNLKRHHIKKFRIRYWNAEKDFYILDVESTYFKQGTLCGNTFGVVKCFKDGEAFDLNQIPDIPTSKSKGPECKIRYDKKCQTYTLFVPELIKVTPQINPRKIISLDPGIRTFMTGLSEDETIKFCTNANSKITPINKKIDYFTKNKQIPKHLKEKLIARCNKKIKNLVTDMHWKTISYLTNTYQTILIGNMSPKGIICNKTSNLTQRTKDLVGNLSFYTFRNRLEYKCHCKSLKYMLVDERYTSKTCSCCGWVNDKLGGNKIFACKNCKVELDRDINGCRGIYLKATN